MSSLFSGLCALLAEIEIEDSKNSNIKLRKDEVDKNEKFYSDVIYKNYAYLTNVYDKFCQDNVNKDIDLEYEAHLKLRSYLAEGLSPEIRIRYLFFLTTSYTKIHLVFAEFKKEIDFNKLIFTD